MFLTRKVNRNEKIIQKDAKYSQKDCIFVTIIEENSCIETLSQYLLYNQKD